MQTSLATCTVNRLFVPPTAAPERGLNCNWPTKGIPGIEQLLVKVWEECMVGLRRIRHPLLELPGSTNPGAITEGLRDLALIFQATKHLATHDSDRNRLQTCGMNCRGLLCLLDFLQPNLLVAHFDQPKLTKLPAVPRRNRAAILRKLPCLLRCTACGRGLGM